MATTRLSIPLPEPVSPPKAGISALLDWSAQPPGTVEITLLDEDEQQVAEPIEVPVPPVRAVEVPGAAGAMEWRETRAPLAFDADVDAARFLKVRFGLVSAVHEIASLAAPLPRPPDATFPLNPAGMWQIALVSELFDHPGAFDAVCRSLRDHMRGQAPFDQPDVMGRINLVGLYWHSGPEGNFSPVRDGRLLLGDNERVKRFVALANVQPRLIMVLARMDERCGAGGTSDTPAWTSTKAADNEDWRDIVLHELGHSFGLADEYSDDSQVTPEPNPLESNVTANPDPFGAPWAHMCSHDHPGIPTRPWFDSSDFPPDVIGTFEGARYKRKKRYRPTVTCRMLWTNHSFCPVCCRLIEQELGL